MVTARPLIFRGEAIRHTPRHEVAVGRDDILMTRPQIPFFRNGHRMTRISRARRDKQALLGTGHALSQAKEKPLASTRKRTFTVLIGISKLCEGEINIRFIIVDVAIGNRRIDSLVAVDRTNRESIVLCY